MHNAHHRSPLANRRGRSAFTMMELMLVMAILAAIAAMSWPAVSRAYEGLRLKKAGEQLQAAFGHARVQAMTSGVSQVFTFQPGTGQYTVSSLQDGSETTESDSAAASSSSATISPSPSSTPAAAPAGSSVTTGDNGSGCVYQLPDGYLFAGSQRVLDSRAATAESEISGNSTSSADTPPVLFYPDGTASEAVVTISNPTGRSISVTLRGLTGVARMGDIFTGEAPNEAH